MFWKKFLSRKFLLAAAVLVLGVLQEIAPGTIDILDWKVTVVLLSYIFGEAGVDIIRAYIEWTKPKA